MEQAIHEEAHHVEVLRLLNQALETVSKRVEDRLRARWPLLLQNIQRQHPALFRPLPSQAPAPLSGSQLVSRPANQPKTASNKRKPRADALCSDVRAPRAG